MCFWTNPFLKGLIYKRKQCHTVLVSNKKAFFPMKVNCICTCLV